MSDRRYNVLFLCTGNSARSIFGETIINSLAARDFRGFSAGSRPQGRVHPIALDLLRSMKLPVEDLRSKPWDEFAAPEAPPMDFVFTVCDRAAAESCPVWPGQPMTAHWGIPDPAAVAGDDKARMRAFREAFFALRSRISLFINLPIASLDRLRLKRQLDRIGQLAVERPEQSGSSTA